MIAFVIGVSPKPDHQLTRQLSVTYFAFRFLHTLGDAPENIVGNIEEPRIAARYSPWTTKARELQCKAFLSDNNSDEYIRRQRQ